MIPFGFNNLTQLDHKQKIAQALTLSACEIHDAAGLSKSN